MQGWAVLSIVYCQFLVTWHNAHIRWPNFWLVLPSLVSSILVGRRILSWWFRDVYQILCVGFVAFLSQVGMVWRVGKIGRYQSLCSTYGKVAHHGGCYDPLLLCFAWIAHLLMVKPRYTVALVFSVWSSSALRRRLAPLVCVHLLFFLRRSITCFPSIFVSSPIPVYDEDGSSFVTHFDAFFSCCSFLSSVCSWVLFSLSASLEKNCSSPATSEEDVANWICVVCIPCKFLSQIFTVTFSSSMERKSAAVFGWTCYVWYLFICCSA